MNNVLENKCCFSKHSQNFLYRLPPTLPEIPVQTVYREILLSDLKPIGGASFVEGSTISIIDNISMNSHA